MNPAGTLNRRNGHTLLFCFYAVLVVASSLAVMSTVAPGVFPTIRASEVQPVNANVDTNRWFSDVGTSARGAARAIIFDTYSFQLSVSPNSQTIQQGKTAVYIVKVSLVSGVSQPTQLAVTSVPSGLTATLATTSGTPPFESLLQVSSSNSMTPGTYQMTVQAQSSGIPLPQNVQITVVVQQVTTTTTTPISVSTTHTTSTSTTTTSISTTISPTTSTLTMLTPFTSTTTIGSTSTTSIGTLVYTTVSQFSQSIMSYTIATVVTATSTTYTQSASRSTTTSTNSYTTTSLTRTYTTLTQTISSILKSLLTTSATTTTTQTLSSTAYTTTSTTSTTTVPATLTVPSTEYSTTFTSISTSTSTSTEPSTTYTSTTHTSSTTSSLSSVSTSTSYVPSTITFSATSISTQTLTFYSIAYTVSVAWTSFTGNPSTTVIFQLAKGITTTSTTTSSAFLPQLTSSTSSTTSTSSSTSTTSSSQTTSTTSTSTSISTSSTTTTTTGYVAPNSCTLTVVLLPNATGAPPLTVTFNAYALSTESSVVYNWYYGDYYYTQTTSVSIVSGTVATHTYFSVADYTAGVQVHDSSGCFAQSQVAVTVLGAVISEFSPNLFAVFAVGLVLVLTFANKFKHKPRVDSGTLADKDQYQRRLLDFVSFVSPREAK